MSLRGALARGLVRRLARHPVPRALLNAWYNMLSLAGQARFQQRFGRLFFEDGARLTAGAWTVRIGDKRIRLPLRPAQARIDWVNALALAGHDIEVKATYLALLKDRPDVFLDVGANFGTHSLLFAAHGVRALAFEPNLACRDYAATAAALNGVAIEWHPVALGDRDGTAELAFPARETWMGSTAPDIHRALADEYGAIERVAVPMRRLDEHAEALHGKRIVLKIDVESTEAEVLRGAARLIAESRPIILFESNERERRAVLHGLLTGHGYAVRALPWPRDGHAPLDEAAFAKNPGTNFIALKTSG